MLHRLENLQVDLQNYHYIILKKVKEYFKFLDDIANKSKEEYVEYLFKGFESIFGKDLNENTHYQGEEILEINESNHIMVFSNFKVKSIKYKNYYSLNKSLFLSVKLSKFVNYFRL